MKANVGGIDKVLRIVVGLALVAWVLFLNGPIWAWVGVIVAATGLLNFCGLYTLFGVSTCKVKS